MAGRIERVLGALAAADVEYLVVGGVAVVLHGHLRATADLDLVVRLERDNVLRAVRALKNLGFVARAPVDLEAFADASQRQSWIDDKHMRVFSLWHPDETGFEIDLFVEEPFDFSTVYARAVRVSLDGSEAIVASIADLIDLKRSAGRPQDLADVEALQALMEDEAP